MFSKILFFLFNLGFLMSCTQISLYNFFKEEIIRLNLNYVKNRACYKPATTWATLCNEAFKCVKKDNDYYNYSLFPRYYCFKDDNENKCIVKNVIVHGDVISQNLMSCYTREKIISGITLGPCENYNEISIYRLNSDVLWVFKKIQGTDSFSLFKRCLINKQMLKYVKTDLLNSNLPMSIRDEADMMRMMLPLTEYLSDVSSFQCNILKTADDIRFLRICNYIFTRSEYINKFIPVGVPQGSHLKKGKAEPMLVQVNETTISVVWAYSCKGMVLGSVKYIIAAVSEHSTVAVLRNDVEINKFYYVFHEIILNLSESLFPGNETDEF